MRGTAAIAVLVFHIQGRLGSQLPTEGYLAVDFFFALSGFVVDQAYGGRLTNGMGVGRFIGIRLIRLYPLFALGMILGLLREAGKVLLQESRDMSWAGLAIAGISNLLMLPAPFAHGPLFPLNGPSWSLFFELVINLLFAIGLVRLRTRILVVLAGLCAGVLGFVALKAGSLDVGWDWETFAFGLARVGFSFPVGVIFSRLHVGNSRRFGSAASVGSVLLLMAFLLIKVQPEFHWAFDLAAVFAVLPAMLWLGANSELPSTLRSGACLLGDISYPLYALQSLVVIFLSPIQRLVHQNDWLVTGLCVAVGCGIAWLAHRKFDIPARHWLGVLRESADTRLLRGSLPVPDLQAEDRTRLPAPQE